MNMCIYGVHAFLQGVKLISGAERIEKHWHRAKNEEKNIKAKGIRFPRGFNIKNKKKSKKMKKKKISKGGRAFLILVCISFEEKKKL